MEVGQFLSHGRREEQRVVGADRDAHARLVQRADRMRCHRRRETRPHVAGGADVEDDPSLRQVGDQRGVLDGAHAVGNALHV